MHLLTRSSPSLSPGGGMERTIEGKKGKGWDKNNLLKTAMKLETNCNNNNYNGSVHKKGEQFTHDKSLLCENLQ